MKQVLAGGNLDFLSSRRRLIFPSQHLQSLFCLKDQLASRVVMVLVTYSDSEGSDLEEQPAQPVKPVNKASFQKVVDSSNPRKIRVNLPTPTKDAIESAIPNPERPAKRARTGGAGVFSGLSSFLPAPKRSGEAVANASSESSNQTTKTKSTSSSVNLKTGSAPAFSRAAASNQDEGYDAPQEQAKAPTIATTVHADDVKFVGKATMFRPLSVTRKPQVKKKKVATIQPTTAAVASIQENEAPKPKSKVSLFSFAAPDEPLPELPTSNVDEAMETEQLQEIDQHYEPPVAQTPQPQTLNSLASDLQLDEATRRKLFGRKGKGTDVPVNLINFNTDNEYAANEELRAKGDSVQHNPLRTIQPGKHTLRQLVNAATTQKDALEEAWAAGKRNQKEAGNRYGW
jgi:hypothetical protein